jgi:hypothetical protein|tara:strand:- start:192 stop:512 length:321 start_codon:yes stop_codon:yes gene_type:complete
MNDEIDTKRPGPMAVLCYFVLAFPAAAAPAMLFGIVQSAGPQRQFEGSGGMGVIVSMMMAYGIVLLIILSTYISLHGKARPLYIANGILGAMTLVVLMSLSWHGVL